MKSYKIRDTRMTPRGDRLREDRPKTLEIETSRNVPMRVVNPPTPEQIERVHKSSSDSGVSTTTKLVYGIADLALATTFAVMSAVPDYASVREACYVAAAFSSLAALDALALGVGGDIYRSLRDRNSFPERRAA